MSDPARTGDDPANQPNTDHVSGESSMRHTRHASIATIAIALGLALTTVGISRGLPHEVGGIGSRFTVAADAWASGSAVSPPLVLLVVVALLAALATRATRGGARSAAWLAVLAGVGIVASVMEPVQQRILLFQEHDLLLTSLLWAAYVTWIALVVACVVRAREGATDGVPAPGPASAAVTAAA
jgi:hypothetical protein